MHYERPLEQDLNTLVHDSELRRGIVTNINKWHQLPASSEKDRQNMIAEARRDKHWERLVFLHSCETWLDVFEAHAGDMRDEVYWPLLIKLYTHLDCIGGAQTRFLRLFLAPGRSREHAIDARSRTLLANRPDPCMLYRGYAGMSGIDLSWSLSRRIAMFFAYRAFERLGDHECPPVLVIGKAFKKDFLAICVERDEAEVIIAGDYVSEVRRRTLPRLERPVIEYM